MLIASLALHSSVRAGGEEGEGEGEDGDSDDGDDLPDLDAAAGNAGSS